MAVNTRILEFKNVNLLTLRLILRSTDFLSIEQNLNDFLSTPNGQLLHGENIVIDAYALFQPITWSKLVELLARYKISVIGIFTNKGLKPSIEDAGFKFIELPNSSKETSSASIQSNEAPKPEVSSVKTEQKPVVPQPIVSSKPSQNLIIERQLRSGERVYAEGGDLVVIGDVSAGAEIIADGNIHVYGHLNGRAVAGAKGDTEAKIFTTHLNPSLVAIAGFYRLFDGDFKTDALGKAAVVSLLGETLQFNPLRM
ncbi:septum site-determining protein MinC [Taylorella equigenitalis]|uniref:septum site-determining protein MinC n=1 Tax=Taylorella equigenitalis TaxID=29575 RepID=UPI0004249672|nr:septum site-determining protein MinC [Taylorella equigenitalis]ASY30945.1 septum site-determining protein MinC [Taylorella equigenitalis]ASY42713.1 septum site-determining protein MinC [Taylorella equigenitalis]KOS59549.1 septum site-determining protein MinC [Taylorella equigenitalis]RBA26592.1 septum site-determining protein MinC [Taylorella equigenitalis]WDU47618.1 septum site-determining protein MinC [Taylorella equigenitalis]